MSNDIERMLEQRNRFCSSFYIVFIKKIKYNKKAGIYYRKNKTN